jgi:hypothetical protein
MKYEKIINTGAIVIGAGVLAACGSADGGYGRAITECVEGTYTDVASSPEAAVDILNGYQDASRFDVDIKDQSAQRPDGGWGMTGYTDKDSINRVGEIVCTIPDTNGEISEYRLTFSGLDAAKFAGIETSQK